MRLRVMPLPPHVVLQATYRKIKRIANRGFQISAGGVLSWFAVNHNFLARSGDVNSHLVQVAVPMMSMWLIDDHPATHYAPQNSSSRAAYSRTVSSTAAECGML